MYRLSASIEGILAPRSSIQKAAKIAGHHIVAHALAERAEACGYGSSSGKAVARTKRSQLMDVLSETADADVDFEDLDAVQNARIDQAAICASCIAEPMNRRICRTTTCSSTAGFRSCAVAELQGHRLGAQLAYQRRGRPAAMRLEKQLTSNFAPAYGDEAVLIRSASTANCQAASDWDAAIEIKYVYRHGAIPGSPPQTELNHTAHGLARKALSGS